MALSPDKKGTIKDIVDIDTVQADVVEGYLDSTILNSNELPVVMEFREFDFYHISDTAVAKLRERYLAAGWKSFDVNYLGDSISNFLRFELR